MNKKTRLIVLFLCILCFFVIAPVLVSYSEGYRIDFKKMSVVATGGIYVRTFPAADKITIDYGIIEKPGLFANSIFVQSLLPENHTVSILKNGYYDYFKTLPVKENEVTKLENVLLIKKDIKFTATPTPTTQTPPPVASQYIIKNNNLYYSNQKLIPVIKKIVAFNIQGNSIIWIGTDGFLYKSDLANLTVAPVKLISANRAKSVAISPDGKNIVFNNNNSIYISTLSTTPLQNSTLYSSSEKISNVTWLNNDYIIFTSGQKILISEIDYRGNINTIVLSQTLAPSDKFLFNPSDSKIYIQTKTALLVSEKITP